MACVVGKDSPELFFKLSPEVVLIVYLCVVLVDECVQSFAQLTKGAAKGVDVPFFWCVEALRLFVQFLDEKFVCCGEGVLYCVKLRAL